MVSFFVRESEIACIERVSYNIRNKRVNPKTQSGKPLSTQKYIHDDRYRSKGAQAHKIPLNYSYS